MFHQFFQLLKLTSTNLSDNEEDETEAVLTMTIIMIFTVMMSIFINKHNRIEQL